MSDQYTDQSSDPDSDPDSDQQTDSGTGSYERTNVLTNPQDSSLDLTFGDARAHTAIIIGFLGLEAERHPVLRRGDREPIDWLTRIGVLLRDASTCKRCGLWMHDGANLDHVTPWSAEGSDRSENLRVLCPDCNTERSNFVDLAEDRRVLPVTWWCIDCWAEDLAVHARWHRIQPERRACWLDNTHNDDLWQAWMYRPHLDVDQPLVLAYCAHCDATGYTTVTL